MSDVILQAFYDENLGRVIRIPIGELLEQYPDYVPVLRVKRPTDPTYYPAAYTQMIDNDLVWTLTEVDTQFEGYGEAQVWMRKGDDYRVTRNVQMVQFKYSLADSTVDVPEPVVPYLERAERIGTQVAEGIEQVTGMISSVEQNASNAETFANNAEASAEAAGSYSEAAEGFANQAQQSATDAELFSEAAEGYASSAEASSESAGLYSSAAEGFAEAAEQSATAADASAEDAKEAARKAEHFAQQGGGDSTLVDQLERKIFKPAGDELLVFADLAEEGKLTRFEGYRLAGVSESIQFGKSTYYAGYYMFAPKAGHIKMEVRTNYGQLVIAKGVQIAGENFDTPWPCTSGVFYNKAALPTDFIEFDAGDFIAFTSNDIDAGVDVWSDVFVPITDTLGDNIIAQTNDAAMKMFERTGVGDVFDYTTSIERGTINGTGSSNGLNNDSATYKLNNIRCADYVEIQRPETAIIIENRMEGANINVWFYDEDKNLLPSNPKTNVKDGVFPQEGAKYFRYRIGNTNGITPDDIKDFAIYQRTVTGTKKHNKTIRWCAMGDSITEGWYSYTDGDNATSAMNRARTWINYAAEINGYTVDNIAIGGTGWVMNPQDKRSARKLANETDFSGYDLVTLFYGVNDWKGSKHIGSMDDPVLSDDEVASAVDGTGTIYANMRYVIEKIMRDNPVCKIIIITPLNCWQNGSNETNWGLGYAYPNAGTLEDLFQVERDVAEYYGIGLVDMTHGSMINRMNIQRVLLDKVHPSADAHRIIGYELASKIAFNSNAVVKQVGGAGGAELDRTLTDSTKAAPADIVGNIKDDIEDLKDALIGVDTLADALKEVAGV